ncbi:MAG: Phosphomevalonate kinase [Rhodanobacteraceae bacterium]|nr:MAG: Phosphomevalonate kinase [Rhodanobacteraceae bacterium]
MTRIVASAPGKLVLLGEYAVLEGAPALVMAVDRRARATLANIDGDCWEIVSPTLGLHARLRLRGHEAAWIGTAPAELEWTATLLARFPQARALPPCRIELDSDAFHLEHAGARTKLGLGSSAALAVALLGALHAHANLAPPTLGEAIAAHRAIQHGQGSGIDIAASLKGGLSRFALHDDTARAAPQQLPDGLRWCCVYSGRPASTRAMLQTVAAWREREPTAFAQRTRELATISSRGIDAMTANDATAFLSSFHDYAGALARFGEAAGADIASREHRAIAAIAAECGCFYKSCGAGGGDVGVTFAVEDVRLRAFAGRVVQAGFPVIDLEADPKGLEVVSSV